MSDNAPAARGGPQPDDLRQVGRDGPVRRRQAPRRRRPRRRAEVRRRARRRRPATHPPSLYRVLRALASVGVFAEDEGGRFRQTPLSEVLRTGVPGSMRAVADYCGADWSWRPWGRLLETVRTGRTAFDEVFGEQAFEYLGKHPDESAVFNEGMTGFSMQESPAVAEAYDFSPFGTIVDVGGGHGHLLCTILKKYPGTKGVVFDSPHVVDGRDAANRRGRAGRPVPGRGRRLLPGRPGRRRLRDEAHHPRLAGRQGDDDPAELPHGGEAGAKLILVEMVIPPGNGPSPGKLLDLEMLVIASGKERTEAEYADLLAGAGWRLTRVVPTRSADVRDRGRRGVAAPGPAVRAAAGGGGNSAVTRPGRGSGGPVLGEVPCAAEGGGDPRPVEAAPRKLHVGPVNSTRLTTRFQGRLPEVPIIGPYLTRGCAIPRPRPSIWHAGCFLFLSEQPVGSPPLTRSAHPPANPPGSSPKASDLPRLLASSLSPADLDILWHSAYPLSLHKRAEEGGSSHAASTSRRPKSPVAQREKPRREHVQTASENLHVARRVRGRAGPERERPARQGRDATARVGLRAGGVPRVARDGGRRGQREYAGHRGVRGEYRGDGDGPQHVRRPPRRGREPWDGWWGPNPPYHHPVFVLTHQPATRWRWKAAPRSTSSPTASCRPSTRPRGPRAGRTSRSLAGRRRRNST